jgi:alpha-beta hydrolase superfamily lysophospholipase
VWRRAAPAVGGTLAGSALVGGLTSTVAAAVFARRILTPDRRRPDDVMVETVGIGSVVLGATPETVVPGRYGLWLDGGSGHARLGDVVEEDDGAGTVTRVLIDVDAGALRPGPARWNGYFHGLPPEHSLGVETEHVSVEGELGPLPAWHLPAPGGDGDRWAVAVHGRGARREECLRAVAPLHEAGLDVLVPMYRNDEGAPPGPDGRYNLGLSEWRDVEAAVAYALDHGARSVALVGWSMGGAIVLQFLDRSPLSDTVDRVVLDGPVVDWNAVLAHHARLHHVPSPISAFARSLMGRSWGKRAVGVRDVLDVASTDWVRRADELHHPLLLIHSDDDEFVPNAPSRALARARPDLVTWVQWDTARHCKEWNTDPARWEAAVREFVSG